MIERAAMYMPARLMRQRGKVPRHGWMVGDDVNADADEGDRRFVELWDDSCPLPIRVYFADPGYSAPLIGFEVGSDEHRGTPLDPATLARVARNLPLYIRYAEALAMLDRKKVDEALEIFAEIGATRRGLPGRFFRVIAAEYSARVKAGDPAPVTSIAEAHGVVKSTASRWLKESRRRGYLNGGTDG